ncbi:MAG TPA: hypothetical protein VF283_22055 [Bryobacteraceae bacterium]
MPLAAAIMLGVIGVIGIGAREPLLFASLGPSAYLAARKPTQRSTTFYNVFVGHMSGLLGVDHTATEATTLLVASGLFRTGADALMVVQGVVIMAFLSEVFRRLRVGQPRPAAAQK